MNTEIFLEDNSDNLISNAESFKINKHKMVGEQNGCQIIWKKQKEKGK